MNSKYPTDYDDVFQLILNLVEEVKRDVNSETRVSADELENYFHRLARGTIGEYEFTRRMGFYKLPVIRIAALPVLWKEYNQPVTPDFIVEYNSEKICVEVKNYNWTHSSDGILIPAISIENCKRFKIFFKLAKACIAIKRLERWYMFDIDNLPKHKRGDNYFIEYSEITKADMFNEDGVIFKIWTTTLHQEKAKNYTRLPEKFSNDGILYNGISFSEDKRCVSLKYCNNDGNCDPKVVPSEKRQFYDNQKDIVKILYNSIASNLKDVFLSGFDWKTMINIGDVIPSVFSIHDRLRDKSDIEDLMSDINTLASSGVVYRASRESCSFYLYAITSKVYSSLSKELKHDNLTFKDIVRYMGAIRSFKKSLNNNI